MAHSTVLSTFIGRERELAHLTSLLSQGDVRLLTLTGSGGVGKTRLALRVAEAVRTAFDDVEFVPLAAIRDPDLVLPTIADELRIRGAAEQPFAARIAAELRDRSLLLVLDNLEQVLAGAALAIASLLAECEGLTVLATSREALRLSGERVVAVAPLATPHAMSHATATEAMATEAVRLFVARAEAVRADLALTDADIEAVAEIVRRLDGVPLAVELAAARVEHLPPVALLRRLERRLPLLTGGARDLPERQRTVRDTIAWSYDLLPAVEQALFRRLAVFAGGCTLEAAEAVVNAPVDLGVETLDGIASLVAKSLLRQETDAHGEPRYLMLETVREYALEQLEQRGESGPVAEAHAAWALAFAERLNRWEVPDRDLSDALARLDAELDNIRAAFTWCAATGDGDALVRMAGGLWHWWYYRARYREGWEWAERALALSPCSDSAARGYALVTAGHLAGSLGAYGAAAERLRDAVDRLRDAVDIGNRVGDERLEGMGLFHLGMLAEDRGDYDEAARSIEAARSLLSSTRHPYALFKTDYHLGVVAFGKGNIAEARELFDCSLAASRDFGAQSDTAYALCWRGHVACAEQDFSRAAADLAACATLVEQPVLAHFRKDFLAAVAVLAAEMSLPEEGARLIGAAEASDGGARLSTSLPEREIYARAIDRMRAALGTEAFERARQQGRLVLDDAVEADLRAVFAAASETGRTHAAADAGGLSAREVEVLRLVADGLTDAEAAQRLSISPRTVGQHLHSVYTKLGVPSRAAATRYAVEHGLV